MVIFVHIKEDVPLEPPRFNNQDPSKSDPRLKKPSFQQSTGVRTHAKHFSEAASRIEILPESRFTIICLQTNIYIYKSNTQELYDIVPCTFSCISSAIYKNHEQRLVLAYLSREDPGEKLLVHDYAINPQTGTDTLYQIVKPFSSGYKIGGI